MYKSNKTWFCKEITTKEAKKIGEELASAIADNNHAKATQLFKKVKKYMRKRIEENYFYPIERFNAKVSELAVPENTAFITMGINCILIELFFEIKNGYDESKEGGTVGNAYKEVLPLLDSNITPEIAEKFYTGVRCGILHQGQTKGDSALTYEADMVFEQNGIYYLSNPKTVFKKLKNLYQEYWKDVSEKNYSDEEARKLIKKYNHIINHIGEVCE